MAKSTLPEDKELASKVIDATTSLESKKADHGFLGLLGDVKNKPSNIAFCVIMLSFVFMVLLLFIPMDVSVSKNQLFAAAWTTITSAVGFLFGRATRT